MQPLPFEIVIERICGKRMLYLFRAGAICAAVLIFDKLFLTGFFFREPHHYEGTRFASRPQVIATAIYDPTNGAIR